MGGISDSDNTRNEGRRRDEAIDHVHPGIKEDVIVCGGKYIEDGFRFFGKKPEVLTEEALAEEYQSLDIIGILLAWDAETNTGNKRLSNEYIAGLVKKYPKTFIGLPAWTPGKVKWRSERWNSPSGISACAGSSSSKPLRPFTPVTKGSTLSGKRSPG